MTPIDFRSPWSRSLRLSTIIVVLALSGCFAFGLLADAGGTFRLIVLCVPPVFLVVAVLQGVRGYVLTETDLRVKRWGWTLRLPLEGLQTAEGKAEAVQGATPLLTYGGVFAYVGFFHCHELGIFRSYATDRARAVVLRYAGRRVVITPHDPQQFIIRVRTLLQTAQFPK